MVGHGRDGDDGEGQEEARNQEEVNHQRVHARDQGQGAEGPVEEGHGWLSKLWSFFGYPEY